MDVNDDLVQIPSVVEESFNPLTHAQLKESIPVFYDLETNGLGMFLREISMPRHVLLPNYSVLFMHRSTRRKL